MSEKRYVIVSPSHKQKSLALFVCEPLVGKEGATRWGKSLAEKALLFSLKQAKDFADSSPIGCYIIEHNQDMQNACSRRMYFHEFMGYVEYWHYEVIRYMPTLKTQTQETPEPLTYALYTETADGQITYYCSDEPKQFITYKKQQVELLSEADALNLQKTINDGALWNVFKYVDIYAIDNVIGMSAPPEAEKLIGYILERDTFGDNPYFCPDAKCENVIEWNGELVQVFQNTEYAQWVADLQYIETGLVWRVKPI